MAECLHVSLHVGFLLPAVLLASDAPGELALSYYNNVNVEKQSFWKYKNMSDTLSLPPSSTIPLPPSIVPKWRGLQGLALRKAPGAGNRGASR